MLTLQRWTAPPSNRQVTLRRVEVTDAAPAERTITLLMLSGRVRIEGLTIADVIAILRGLA